MLNRDYTPTSTPYVSICVLMGPSLRVSTFFLLYATSPLVSLLIGLLELSTFSQINEELILSSGFCLFVFMVSMLCR